MSTWLIVFSAAALSFIFSAMLRKFAGYWGLIDVPNERSSHRSPVPRGGGLAIALVFLAILPLLQIQQAGTPSLFAALYGAGTLIALVGFLDDRRHIPALKRLVAHFLAAAWIIYWLLPQPAAILSAAGLSFWPAALAYAVLLVWLLNLYNFMDGIDAITCSETLTVSLSASLLSWYLLPADPSWLLLLLLASSVAGFLPWNLPPARLFMGDAGSAFLGILLGALIVHAKQLSEPLFYAWLVLLGVYIVDATVTLARRILAGEKFYQAHRTHTYQHAAIRFASHGKISLAVALINLLWLLPIAATVALGLVDGPLALLIAYLPLAATALRFKAGVRMPPPETRR